MNFEVKEILSLDVYRDGGSISASFGDSEGTQHELMFNIDNIASENTEGATIYKSACVNSFIQSEYVSPITGISYPKTEKKVLPVSWNEASQILSELEQYVEGFESDYLCVFESMVKVANSTDHSV